MNLITVSIEKGLERSDCPTDWCCWKKKMDLTGGEMEWCDNVDVTPTYRHSEVVQLDCTKEVWFWGINTFFFFFFVGGHSQGHLSMPYEKLRHVNWMVGVMSYKIPIFSFRIHHEDEDVKKKKMLKNIWILNELLKRWAWGLKVCFSGLPWA